jgi:hypothetical protein
MHRRSVVRLGRSRPSQCRISLVGSGRLPRVGQTSGGRALPRGCLDVARGWNRRAGEYHRMPAVSAGVRWVDSGADRSLPSASAVVAGYASSNQNAACGGSRAGAKVAGVHGSPRGASTARAMAESTTTATTLRRYDGRRTGRTARRWRNTRRKSSAHGTRPARGEPPGIAAVGGGSPEGAGTSARSCTRRLLAGPNTPA